MADRQEAYESPDLPKALKLGRFLKSKRILIMV